MTTPQDVVVLGSEALLPDGTTLGRVHSAEQCRGRACVIHAPIDHAMRSWPLVWRQDGQFFERACEHGVGHPDPSQRAWWTEAGTWYFMEQLRDGVPLRDAETAQDYVAARFVHGCCAQRCCSVSSP